MWTGEWRGAEIAGGKGWRKPDEAGDWRREGGMREDLRKDGEGKGRFGERSRTGGVKAELDEERESGSGLGERRRGERGERKEEGGLEDGWFVVSRGCGAGGRKTEGREGGDGRMKALENRMDRLWVE